MSVSIAEESMPDLPQAAWLGEFHILAATTPLRRGSFCEAEAYYRKATELHPGDPILHNNLGWIRQMRGDRQGAVAYYKRALQLAPRLRIARRNLATLLVQLGRREESFSLWHEELADSEGLAWMQELVSRAMRARELSFAGEYAAILAELRWGSAWHPNRRDKPVLPIPIQAPARFLTIPKLRHDIEQFDYLQRHGVLSDEFTPIIKDYQRVIDRLAARGVDVRVPLQGEDERAIGHVYNRIVHSRYTPRLRRALSGKWDATAVENQYLNKPPGLVVVDDFLTEEALANVRLFCLESTVWSANRYAYGRLGAFLHDGFNCPLLLQIAEELREALPHVIGERYPIRQLWGFKNGQNLPGGSTYHADFAAVNVNFWITPDDANLDERSGGLIVYDVDAPLSWDFDTYNGRTDVIKPFLQRQRAHPVIVPYRQNRAVIFNSDLFHATAGLRFRPGYENRRVNVTMLYGDRENDHRHLAREDSMPAWRSAAFSHVRRPGS
jgi:tetratricopeptide (TPR) repeat protein